MKRSKFRIAIDFDGVINSYKSGWKGIASIPDPPVPGVIDWIIECQKTGHTVIIFSARCASENFMLPFVDDIYSQYELDVLLNESDHEDSDGSRIPYDFQSRFLGVAAMKEYLLTWGMNFDQINLLEFAYAKPMADLFIDDRGFRFEGTLPPMFMLADVIQPWWKK